MFITCTGMGQDQDDRDSASLAEMTETPTDGLADRHS